MRPTTRTDARLEDLLRRLTPQVLGVMVRRYDGLPERPRGWLVTVASRRLTEEIRSASARRRREEADGVQRPTDAEEVPPPEETPEHDDELALLFLCCHPALTAPSQMALTLRAVGGLTTAEIAAAFPVSEATMAQRISRAKQRIAEAGARFEEPSPDERDERLAVVRHVLHLVFNEGYAATAGRHLQRRKLAADAIRLTRRLHDAVPDDAETVGLLALMLLTDARHAARVGPVGELVPLAEQDRSRWDRTLIEEGVDLLMGVLPLGRVGRGRRARGRRSARRPPPGAPRAGPPARDVG